MSASGPAAAVAAAVRSGERSAAAVTSEALAAAAAAQDLAPFNTVMAEQALRRAEEIDRAVAVGEDPGPLAGVPVALKDNICTRGVPTTCSSRILEGWQPPYDATVVTRLNAAGAVIVGKTNMDEFAMGSSTENSAFGPTRNPCDPARVPGGSSGGSAAAVAAGVTPLALGSDTGGSIRQPAALCGVVGMKPTYGRVSRHGLVAFSSSLDQIGPLAHTVGDAALLYGVIGGHDPLDSTSIPEPVGDLSGALSGDVTGMRVGIVTELSGEGVDGDVAARLTAAAETLSTAGAHVGEVSVPAVMYGLSAYYLIAPAEASSNLARYDGVRYGLRVPATSAVEMNVATRTAGFGDEVKRRIMLGTFALSAGVLRRLLRQGSEGADAAVAGLRLRLRTVRPAAGAHVANGGLPLRRAHRQPDGHVHVRRVDHSLQPRRAPGHIGAVRHRRRRPAGGGPDPGALPG